MKPHGRESLIGARWLHQSRAELNRLSENVGRASSLPVDGVSSPRVSGGRMPPELADKMSAPPVHTGSKLAEVFGEEEPGTLAVRPAELAEAGVAGIWRAQTQGQHAEIKGESF